MKILLSSVFAAILSFKVASDQENLTILKWNKVENFLRFDIGSSVKIGEHDKISHNRSKEIHNFNGRSLHLMYFEEGGFFHFYENDTKVSGLAGDMWTAISELFNFTLNVTNVPGGSLGITFPNGTYGGILEYARLNKTDIIPQMAVFRTRHAAVEFTTVYWTTSQRIFTHGQWKRNRLWMINLFSVDVWCFIFAFIVTLSIVSTLSQRALIRQKIRKLESHSCVTHLFYTYSTVCNQGNAPQDIVSGSRILSFTISIFSWLTLVGYSSVLIYSMAQEVFDAPFEDLDSLLDKTNFQILVLKGSVAHITFASAYSMPVFGRARRKHRLSVISTVEKLYDYVCSDSNKYVMFDSEDAVAARGSTACKVDPVGVAYYVTPVAGGISRRFKYKKTLDIGVMKLHEHGLISAMKKRYMAYPIRGTKIRHAEGHAVDMDCVSFIFAVFFFGVIASIVICITENIIFTLTKSKKGIGRNRFLLNSNKKQTFIITP